MFNNNIHISNKNLILLNKNETNSIVDGIYNYYDRWCEHCLQKDKCSVFHLEEESKNNLSKGEKDLSKIADIFALTIDLLDELSDEAEIDIFEIEDLEFEKHKLGEIEKLANSYGKDIYHWLDNNSDIFRNQILLLEDINKQSAIDIRHAIKTIDYYSLLIGAKTHRAFVKDVFVSESNMISESQSDQNGSAKVAILSIDKSIDALDIILGDFPDCEIDTLNLLAKLQRIKRLILLEFPQAMSFIRPGLDS